MSLWGSHVPSCPLGPCWGRSHIPLGVPCPLLSLWCPLGQVPHPFFEGGGSNVPLGGLMSLWGSHIPSCPLGPFWGRFHIPFGGGGVPCPFGVPCPLLSLRSLLGGSYVPYRVLCPLLSLRSLWSVPHPFWGGVPHPFGGPVSPPIP